MTEDLIEVVDPETGEVIVLEEGEQDLAVVVHRRHEAHAQEKLWAENRKRYDAILKARAESGGVFDDVQLRFRGGTYSTFDGERFARAIRASEIEPTYEMWLIAMAASKGFKRDALPVGLFRDAFDKATDQLPKRPWVETSKVRRLAADARRER